MIHELKEIFYQAIENQQKGIQNVLVTVVNLVGSSYRKPGVRMLIDANQKMTGAVSGGCVEKEILRRSTSVFESGKSKIITYDGRYRLGCEGILYILIEPFFLSKNLLEKFNIVLQKRESLQIKCTYVTEDEVVGDFGTTFIFEDATQVNFGTNSVSKPYEVFEQTLQPVFRLLIIGGEHDAVKLCKQAALLGWQVDVVTSAKDSKLLSDFPGATSVTTSIPETADFGNLQHTAIVLMNHSYNIDLKYLVKLSNQKPTYLGMLGAPSRRERLFTDVTELLPEIDIDFLDSIHTPAGLQIGAKTPEEIAISIIAEILAVINQKEPYFLKNLMGKIHN